MIYWLCKSHWLCGSQQTGKFFKKREYQTTSPACWKICMLIKKQQLELDMEQQTGFQLGKEYVKDVHCHPAYLTYMQSTSWEMPAGWSTSWNQDCWEYRLCRWHHRYSKKQGGSMSRLIKMKEESKNVDLKLNIQKTRIMASSPITLWQIDGEAVETVADIFFFFLEGGLQNHCRLWLWPWN